MAVADASEIVGFVDLTVIGRGKPVLLGAEPDGGRDPSGALSITAARTCS